MRTETIVFAVSSILVFFVYFITSAPGLGLVDSGELTAVANTLGVAHPTGYPLYTLLGRVWLLLLPSSPARAMVIFSVACGAIASGILGAAILKLVQWTSQFHKAVAAAVAIGLALAGAFSISIWTSVVYAEVYPLTFLIASLVLWIVLTEWTGGGRESSMRLALLASFLWGIGFGNHYTILWFFPLILWIVIRVFKRSARPTETTLFIGVAFLVGASINLYLPLRSSVDPPLDWSDPQSLSSLFHHLSAWQYRVWMFKGDMSGFFRNFLNYLAIMPRELGTALLIMTGLGLFRAIMRRTWIFLLFAFVWLLGVAYNLNYSIPDISTYFVSFYSPLLLIAGYGFAGLIRFMQVRFRETYLRIVVLIIALTLPAFSILSNARAANHAHHRFATEHALAVLETLPLNAIVFHGNWDIQSPVLYLQTVEHERRDVVMLDLPLLQRPWYLKQETRRNPEVFDGTNRELAEFLRAVAPFEAGEEYNGQEIEAAYVGLINRIVDLHYRSRPVYVRDTRSIGHPGVAARFPSYPGGYFFRVSDQPTMEPALNADRLLKSQSAFDERERHLLRQAAVSAAMQGMLAMELGDTVRVREATGNATRLAPGDPAIMQFLTKVTPLISDRTQSQ